MNAKNTTKSPIHENADANITCDFGDGDINRFRNRLHGQTTTYTLTSYAGLMSCVRVRSLAVGVGVSLRARRHTTQVMLGLSLRVRWNTTLAYIIAYA